MIKAYCSFIVLFRSGDVGKFESYCTYEFLPSHFRPLFKRKNYVNGIYFSPKEAQVRKGKSSPGLNIDVATSIGRQPSRSEVSVTSAGEEAEKTSVSVKT